jgi:hypothetical protein
VRFPKKTLREAVAISNKRTARASSVLCWYEKRISVARTISAVIERRITLFILPPECRITLLPAQINRIKKPKSNKKYSQ